MTSPSTEPVLHFIVPDEIRHLVATRAASTLERLDSDASLAGLLSPVDPLRDEDDLFTTLEQEFAVREILEAVRGPDASTTLTLDAARHWIRALTILAALPDDTLSDHDRALLRVLAQMLGEAVLSLLP